MTIRLADQIRCADREVAMRKNVYPTRVSAGRMPQEEADRETEGMEAIARTLRWLSDYEELFRDVVRIQKSNPAALAALRRFPEATVREAEK